MTRSGPAGRPSARDMLPLARSGVGLLASIAVTPMVVRLRCLSLLVGPDRACLSISERAALWPGLSGVYLRRALLPWLIAAAGQEISIGLGTILTKRTIELGNSVYIGRYCILGDVRIGDQTLVSDHVRLLSGQHGMAPDRPVAAQASIYRVLCVGADVWVGSGATILADLSDHCVIGAGSVVTKLVPAYAIMAGNPVRPIGDRRERGTGAP